MTRLDPQNDPNTIFLKILIFTWNNSAAAVTTHSPKVKTITATLKARKNEAREKLLQITILVKPKEQLEKKHYELKESLRKVKEKLGPADPVVSSVVVVSRCLNPFLGSIVVF